MEEILKQILNELKEMRVDINELKQEQNRTEQNRLEVGQEKLQKNLVDRLLLMNSSPHSQNQ